MSNDTEAELRRRPLEGGTADEREPKAIQFLKRRGKTHSPPLTGRVFVYDLDTSQLNVRGRKDLDSGMKKTASRFERAGANPLRKSAPNT